MRENIVLFYITIGMVSVAKNMVFLTDLLFRDHPSYRRDEHCSSENDGRHLYRKWIDRIIAFSAMRMVNDHSVALRKHVFASRFDNEYWICFGGSKPPPYCIPSHKNGRVSPAVVGYYFVKIRRKRFFSQQ